MFDAQRLRQLHALGLAPMHLRGRAVAQADEPASQHNVADATQATDVRLHLWFPPGETDAFAGPHARLLTQVLASLGLAPGQVREGGPDDGPATPLLAFGPGAPEGSTRLAALVKLRDPIEKRIAWPLLRGLRRRLRQARG